MNDQLARRKVAVHTYLNSDNYGSVLQAYALLTVLFKLGYDAFVIDYYKDEVKRMYQIFKPNETRYNILSNCYSILHYSQLLAKKTRFEQFRKKYIKKTSIQYTEHRQLKLNPPEADCYICGSDQVWNTQIIDFDSSFLLDFIKSGKRISYAASGITKNTPDWGMELLVRAIEHFDAVSVRDAVAEKRINKYIGNAAVQVLDPVLLLSPEEWKKNLSLHEFCVEECSRVGSSTKPPYMLCYFSGGVSRQFERYSCSLAQKMGVRRMLIMPEWRNVFRFGEKYYQAGPIEFITLLNSAEIVCTNSFHGTAFSILMNKPFFVGMHPKLSEDRITSLLHLFGLEKRAIDPFEAVPDVSDVLMDFTNSNSILRVERDKSINWLNAAIEC